MATYCFGVFSVKDNESLWINETLVPLSPLQLRLLSYLCSHPQQVLDKERIVANVWGRSDVSDVSLARAIHGLRNRLAAGSKASELIRNIYGRGYMLTQPVSVIDDRSVPASETGNGNGKGNGKGAEVATALRGRSPSHQDHSRAAMPALAHANLRAVN